MPRNIQNERVRIYLADPEYYKERVGKHMKATQLAIACTYLDNKDTSLFLTGREFHISPERTRQIVATFLRKVFNISLRRAREDKKLMYYMKDRKGYKLYKANPDEYYYKLKENFSDKTGEIVSSFLDDDKSTEQISTEMQLTRSYVYAIVGKAIDYVEQLDSQKSALAPTIEKPAKADTPAVPMKLQGIPLTQEEFDEIKAHLFRGETAVEISKIIGRTSGLIGFVRKAETLEDYFAISKQSWSRYTGGKRTPVEERVEKPNETPPKEVETVALDEIMQAVVIWKRHNPEFEILFSVKLKD
jgi:hypothetical protein